MAEAEENNASPGSPCSPRPRACKRNPVVSIQDSSAPRSLRSSLWLWRTSSSQALPHRDTGQNLVPEPRDQVEEAEPRGGLCGAGRRRGPEAVALGAVLAHRFLELFPSRLSPPILPPKSSSPPLQDRHYLESLHPFPLGPPT